MRNAIARTFVDRRIGSVYGALACGADIIFAEAALAASAALHVVLPLPVDLFFEGSVRIGNPPDAPTRWDDRFRTCLKAAASLTLLVEHAPDRPVRDFIYFYAFRLAAGLALIDSDRAKTDCIMLTLADGRSVTNIAGAPKAVRDWQEAGRPLVALPIDLEHRNTVDRKERQDSFRPVVFSTLGGLPELERKIGAGISRKYELIGSVLVLHDMHAAAEVLGGAQEPAGIVADFGPVAGPDGNFDEAQIAQLPGANLRTGAGPGGALATLQFAAEARFLSLDMLKFEPVPDSSDSSHSAAVPMAYALSFRGS